MNHAGIVRRAAFILVLGVFPAHAQAWRHTAASLGTTARVLIVGTRPEDEDNALIAWLSLGRNIETAYLSLTRGESGVNVAGTERQWSLGAVRTAELVAERERDGAHQYFTRAFDFGPTGSDSIVNAAWPHDSLLRDVVSVIRAFRPHVVISMFNDSLDRDATHRMTARLVREAFAAAADTARVPPAAASYLPPWTAARLVTVVDSTSATAAGVVALDVGEFDRDAARSYAELGGDIRVLQRTQPPPSAPAIGHVWRYVRPDSGPSSGDGLFGSADTSLSRFSGLPDQAQVLLDAVRSHIADLRQMAPTAEAESVTVALARLVNLTAPARRAVACSAVVVFQTCKGAAGDLGASLERIRDRATSAAMDAAGFVVDATVERELVAVNDSVPVTVAMRNGGRQPVVVRYLRAVADNRRGTQNMLADSALIAPDSVARFTANLRVGAEASHWWQRYGLIEGTSLQEEGDVPVNQQLISGEDRIGTSGVQGRVAFGGIEIPFTQKPLVYRSADAVRGDNRHPLATVTSLSVLLEGAAQYERAGLPIARLFPVYLQSVVERPDTVTVTIKLSRRWKADSTSRTVIVSPFGSRSVFFPLRGSLKPGPDTVFAEAALAAPARSAQRSTEFVENPVHIYGVVSRDYPHIPTQHFFRSAFERFEAVDLRMPPHLHVAYLKGSGEMLAPLGQLRVNVQPLDPALVPFTDLSGFSTVLIASDGLTGDALAAAVPPLRDFMRKGGTVVVLAGDDEFVGSGLLPYPIAVDSTPLHVSDPQAPVTAADPNSPLLSWPNRITAADFAQWVGERARNIPTGFDGRYRTVLSVAATDKVSTPATILVASVGKGTLVYTSLAFDRQLAAINPGAARLFVNLLSVGQQAAKAKH